MVKRLPDQRERTSSRPYGYRVDASVRRIPPDVLSWHRAEDERTSNARTRVELGDEGYYEVSSVVMQQNAEIALGSSRTSRRSRQRSLDTTALILGMGKGNDTPLAWLAEKFDRVTAVDTRGHLVEAGVKALPKSLQRKVEIVVADITGTNADLILQLNATRAASPSVGEFIAKTQALFGSQSELEKKALSFGGNYTFVSSNLVLSQLLELPIQWFEHLMAQYEDQPTSLPTAALTALADRAEAAHIRYLANQTAVRGVVHLAEVYSKEIKATAFQPAQTNMFVERNKIEAEIAKHFVPVPKRRLATVWPYDDRTTYTVIFEALQPK